MGVMAVMVAGDKCDLCAAEAQGCAGLGINLNNACGSYSNAIKGNATRILQAACSDLQTELFKPQYPAPTES